MENVKQSMSPQVVHKLLSFRRHMLRRMVKPIISINQTQKLRYISRGRGPMTMTRYEVSYEHMYIKEMVIISIFRVELIEVKEASQQNSWLENGKSLHSVPQSILLM